MDDRSGWYLNNLGFRGYEYFNFFVDLFFSFLHNKALDLVSNFFDFLYTYFNFSGNLDSLFDLLDLFNNSCLQSFLSDWYINRDLLVMNKLHNLGYFYQFRSSN